ncbi:MAG: hypothetical protein HQL19_08895, partial [Candidatus Omnitrophica bacterium]|nr:hypothetical protein [Candidatus Omnitrophota bacterium]
MTKIFGVLLRLVLGTILFAGSQSVVFAAPAVSKHILYINSYHKGYPWSDDLMNGMDAGFARSGLDIEMYTRFMDMKRLSGDDYYVEKLKEEYKAGFRKEHFDLILVSDNDAFDFIRKYRQELFPGVGVVFSGINDFEDSMMVGQENMTGVVEDTDYEDTIRLAQKLFPKVRTIVIVTDETTTGRAHWLEIQKILPHFGGHLDFRKLSLGDFTLDGLVKRLAALQDDSAVLLLSHFKDKDGRAYSMKQSVRAISQRAAVPCFVVNSSRLGYGPLGGKVTSGYYQGEAMSDMAVRILHGTDIRSIPILRISPNKYMFDSYVLRHFHVPENALPANSIVMNTSRT